MKKVIASMSIIVVVILFSILVYHKITYEKINYNYTTFEKIPSVLKKNNKIIIFIQQDGCSPCKLVDPIINNYAKNNKNIVYSIITNKEKDYANQLEKYRVKGTPTLIFYRNGKEVQRINNAITETEFYKIIKKMEF